MKRDMTLYKYSDIDLLLAGLPPAALDSLYARARELEMADICSCVILWTDALLTTGNQDAVEYARRDLAGRESLLDTVISPSERKVFIYTQKDIRARFFAANRAGLLKEAAPCGN